MSKKTDVPLPVKKYYAKPKLTRYGQVRSLVQAGTGGGPEGTMTTRLDMQMLVSDRMAKECIVRIGQHPLGIGLYLFDYKPGFRASCGHGRQFGVMADEVESVMPQAVSVHTDGYKQVDYAMLGIRHSVR